MAGAARALGLGTALPPRFVSAAFAVLLGGPLLGLVVYLISEDDYRGDGTSRWDAYGSPARAAFWISSALVLGAIGALMLGETRGRRWPRPVGIALGALAALGLAYTFVAFTVN